MANLAGRSVRRSLAWDGGGLRAFEAVYQPHSALAMHEHAALNEGRFYDNPSPTL